MFIRVFVKSSEHHPLSQSDEIAFSVNTCVVVRETKNLSK